jgi:protein-histidine N-methyltransferase
VTHSSCQLSSLPDKLSFSTVNITSPLNHTTCLPRRDLFDVRLQLMAEDEESSSIPSGLDASDLAPNVYEGGFKTWECSLDLCRFLLDRGPRRDLDDMARVSHVLEMGCGSALPSLLLFQHAVRAELAVHFTLTDYNADVLRLVTLPNVLLAWVAALSPPQNTALFPHAGAANPLQAGTAAGELYLSPALLQAFSAHLTALGISLTLISGSWAPTESFAALVPQTLDREMLILGSETIYSPASLSAFTDAMAALMKRVKAAKAIVAAKRVYFGVGGSVDGFRAECAAQGCVAWEVEFEGLGGEGEGGVRRCLVEVQMC